MKTSVILVAISWAAVALAPADANLHSVQPRTLRRRTDESTVLRSSSSSSGRLRTASNRDCGGLTTTCSDCSTVLTCTRIGQVYRPTSTSACSGDTPYCSGGACVETLPDNDACNLPPAPSTDFVCNGDGYYPDPASCRDYYLCVNNTAYAYDCSSYSNTVYSHARAMCVPSSEATCSTVTCRTATIGTYQLYGQDNSVYFVCTDTTAANAYVGACPRDYRVDDDGNCTLACMREGRIVNAEDNTRYYECIQTGNNAYSVPIPSTCPIGSTFDADTERCVVSTQAAEPTNSFNEDYYIPSDTVSEDLYRMPANLLVGSASAAYQVEGAWNVSGKGVSVQDVYFHSRPEDDNGDVACDSYNRWQEDIAMLQTLQMQMYRFSISWTRILPTGASDNVNQDGVDYYNNLIDALIAANITPVVTLHHWDMPQVYQNDGGWLVPSIQDRFVNMSDFAFRTFGDRVRLWVLMNEPHIYCTGAYEGTFNAPGLALTGTGGYGCVHNMILAHARAYRLYDSTYRATQGGRIGSSLDLTFGEPLTDSAADAEAAERYMEFMFAWFADPVTFGDYPAAMRQTVDANSRAEGRTTSRLPSFTAEEQQIIRGSWDFIGLNHYATSLVTSANLSQAELVANPSYNNDVNVMPSQRSTWLNSSRSSFQVTPWGMRGVLNWIRRRYNNMPVMVTENGYAGYPNEGTNDPARSGYYSGYMRAAMRAVNEDGCNLIGYTAWSLLDNLEWGNGYDMRFGLVYVDFNSPNRTRTPKSSSTFFQQIMTNRRVHYVEAVPAPQSNQAA